MRAARGPWAGPGGSGGSFGVGGVERELAALLDQSPRPVMNRLGRVEPDPGMTVLIVVVCEEAAKEDTGVVDTREVPGERGTILERLEGRLDVRIVIRYVGSGQ